MELAADMLMVDLPPTDDFEDERTTQVLQAFIDVCDALQVSDPADPLSRSIARAVIGIAAQGELDPRDLVARTLRRFAPGH